MNDFLKQIKNYTFREICAFGYYQIFMVWAPSLIGVIIFRIQLWICGIRCGGRLKAWGISDIYSITKHAITIGRDFSIISSSGRSNASTLFARSRLRTYKRSAKITIGDRVSISGTSITARSKKITIGDGAIIAPNVIITDSDFHALWPPHNRQYNPGFENDADVVIGKNVWIGMNAIILKGARIGDNSIVGAGSIVTGEIPANCVAAGNPAKMIRYLE